MPKGSHSYTYFGDQTPAGLCGSWEIVPLYPVYLEDWLCILTPRRTSTKYCTSCNSIIEQGCLASPKDTEKFRDWCFIWVLVFNSALILIYQVRQLLNEITRYDPRPSHHFNRELEPHPLSLKTHPHATKTLNKLPQSAPRLTALLPYQWRIRLATDKRR